LSKSINDLPNPGISVLRSILSYPIVFLSEFTEAKNKALFLETKSLEFGLLKAYTKFNIKLE
jgi:hypothetical protein